MIHLNNLDSKIVNDNVFFKTLYFLLVEGFLFLYSKQHEQQKQETKVMIIIAADAPTKIPIKTVKLEKIPL